MLVQINREERGLKGAALTTYLSFAGRYCVLMPNSMNSDGISRKIGDIEERKKLKQILSSVEIPERMSVIVRTAGIGRTKKEISKDLTFLLSQWNKIRDYKMHLNSCWVNEMREHEYNPVHVHQGSMFTGLSSVMILKLPESYGPEYSAHDKPTNGRLQIMGNSTGQFCNTDYSPKVEERHFYIFPYDVRHAVYPFNGPGKRRTLSFNCDVDYDPIMNRSAI